VNGSERNLWAETAARGWGEFAQFTRLLGDVIRVTAADEESVCFLAEFEGEPIATGSLSIQEGVALLGGAITVPEWRRRGAHRALLANRLLYARETGCDLAMICAEPGSTSHRNAERQGFRTAYTRIKWGLPEPYHNNRGPFLKDKPQI
jgi:GNAT superfamily N-acetyltransferase